jgi:hypothetical protein
MAINHDFKFPKLSLFLVTDEASSLLTFIITYFGCSPHSSP